MTDWVSPWVLYQDIAIITQRPERALNAAAICEGYTSQASKTTDIVQGALRTPLRSAVTGEQVCVIPLDCGFLGEAR